VLAENLVFFRGKRGLSQEALAHEAGLHRTFVAHVERQVRNIAIDNIERLAIALNVEPYELLRPRRHLGSAHASGDTGYPLGNA
jgi:transcriptional regulator with XRE-family HTH domain